MASIANDKNGRRRILFVDADGSRKTLRLGKVPQKTAEAICRHVEALLAAKIAGQPIPRDTATWLTTIGDTLRDKLAAVGLAEGANRLTVAEFLNRWLADKEAAGFKATSLRAWGQTARELIERFGNKRLADLNHADGEAFREGMRNRGLRESTIHKRLGHAKHFLTDAERLGLIEKNPWKHVKQRSGNPAERRVYVPVADVERVIECCPDVYWRLLVALARYGGLRVPSEAMPLTWQDVDWDRDRLSVPSPKTERQGKPYRVIPLFPLLRPHLEAAFEQAPEGSLHVFPERLRNRLADGWGNLRTQLARIVRRAGIEPWPRLFHNLRASCESDLAGSFPLPTVTKWLGNTPSVALRHYVDPTDAAFELARNWKPKEGSAKSGAREGVRQAPENRPDPEKDRPKGSAKSGAKSGALEAQKAAQQTTAGLGIISHESMQVFDSFDVMREDAKSCDLFRIKLRECMGIEPTGSFVQTPHWF